MIATPPDNPAGPFEPVGSCDSETKMWLIEQIGQTPSQLRSAVSGLTEYQLDTLYKNWTIRQITHHLADSHLHSLIRFKWALTENHPTIKAYEEADWVELADCKKGELEPALLLVDGLHAKWVQVLHSMSERQFTRTFHHPQSGESISLLRALNYYAWHGRHHTAQIRWLRVQHGWGNGDHIVDQQKDRAK